MTLVWQVLDIRAHPDAGGLDRVVEHVPTSFSDWDSDESVVNT
jgi:hypothetical protein